MREAKKFPWRSIRHFGFCSILCWRLASLFVCVIVSLHIKVENPPDHITTTTFAHTHRRATVCMDASARTHTKDTSVCVCDGHEHGHENFSWRVLCVGSMVAALGTHFTHCALRLLFHAHNRSLTHERSRHERRARERLATMCAPLAMCASVPYIRLRECVCEGEKCTREWDGYMDRRWWCDWCMRECVAVCSNCTTTAGAAAATTENNNNSNNKIKRTKNTNHHSRSSKRHQPSEPIFPFFRAYFSFFCANVGCDSSDAEHTFSKACTNVSDAYSASSLQCWWKRENTKGKQSH